MATSAQMIYGTWQNSPTSTAIAHVAMRAEILMLLSIVPFLSVMANSGVTVFPYWSAA